jgi:hypothetical protein
MGRQSPGDGLYFAAEEAIRRERMRRELEDRAQQMTAGQAVAQALGTDDEALGEQIHELGFNGDSARVFDLLPLIHVSWADGKLQRPERALILGLLERRGIARSSDAFVLVESLLEERPSPQFTQVSLDLLKALLARRGQAPTSLVELCLEVADASGGVLGLGNRVSVEERAALQYIADMLGPEAHDELARRLR